MELGIECITAVDHLDTVHYGCLMWIRKMSNLPAGECVEKNHCRQHYSNIEQTVAFSRHLSYCKIENNNVKIKHIAW